MMAEMVDQPFDQQREQLDGDHHEDQGESSACPVGQGGKVGCERGLEPEGGGFREQAAEDGGGEGDEEGEQGAILAFLSNE